MKLLFVRSQKKREVNLARAFVAGAERHGIDCRITNKGESVNFADYDAVAMVGVKSRQLYRSAREARALPIMLDKGYCRHRRAGARTWEYWRVSFGAHHPTRTTLMLEDLPSDRFDALDLRPKQWRKRGSHVLFAGSSAKYHEFYHLPPPTKYAKGVVSALHHHTHLPVIYRPKPSWKDAQPVDGAEYSHGKDPLGPLLKTAYAMVTHGSNICFEAALAGVPMVVLGDAIAAPIAVGAVAQIGEPVRPDRSQWFANLAYHQWTEDEMQDGEMWKVARRWLDRLT